jgi:heptosyltransferase-2
VKRILIIQTASLGDVILATPLIEKLHRFYPGSRIDFLLKYGNESLLRGHPYLKHVMVWDKNEKKYGHLLELLKIIRQEKYDLVVNAQRFVSSGLLTAFSKAKHTTGFKKNPLSLLFTKRVSHKIGVTGNNPHETERNLKLIEHLTDKTFFKPVLYPSQHDYALVSQYKTHKFITVSPASLWFTKQYPKEKWVEFIKDLDDDLTVYFLGGENDRALCDEIMELSGHKNSLNLAGKLTLLQSAALMKDAAMNYTNDSAPMHLCSAVNAPVAAIFCSTVPQFGFGPLSEKSLVIETGQHLKCRPCGIHGRKSCPEKHFECAMSINKNQLLSCIQ